MSCFARNSVERNARGLLGMMASREGLYSVQLESSLLVKMAIERYRLVLDPELPVDALRTLKYEVVHYLGFVRFLQTVR